MEVLKCSQVMHPVVHKKHFHIAWMHNMPRPRDEVMLEMM